MILDTELNVACCYAHTSSRHLVESGTTYGGDWAELVHSELLSKAPAQLISLQLHPGLWVVSVAMVTGSSTAHVG